jgi:hypothetical protein
MKPIRWSGKNDRYFGPFTYAPDEQRHLTCVLTTKGDEEEGFECYLRVSAFGYTILLALPAIVRPWRRKVQANFSPDTIAQLGRDWYWDVNPRQFGFCYCEGFLQVFYGRSSHDSETNRNWATHLSWMDWRMVRHSGYDLSGNLCCDFKANDNDCPVAVFPFHDFDGEYIEATTFIEEREWKRGTKRFKWVSWFSKPMIRRSLNIEFSKETGKEKGSWKGGTLGHSIKCLPGELHEAAFRRYCAAHDMKPAMKVWLSRE